MTFIALLHMAAAQSPRSGTLWNVLPERRRPLAQSGILEAPRDQTLARAIEHQAKSRPLRKRWRHYTLATADAIVSSAADRCPAPVATLAGRRAASVASAASASLLSLANRSMAARNSASPAPWAHTVAAQMRAISATSALERSRVPAISVA